MADTREPNSLFILNGRTGEIERYINTGEKFFGIEICDFNRDGDEEIITGNSDGKLRIFNELLSPVKEASFSTSIKVLDICDFDGNGTNELLVSSRDGKLIILNEQLEELLEVQVTKDIEFVDAKIVNCGKRKKLLYRIKENNLNSYRLASVLPASLVARNFPAVTIWIVVIVFFLFMALVANRSVSARKRDRIIKKIMGVIPHALVMVDGRNRITYINDKARKLFHKESRVLSKRMVSELWDEKQFKPLYDWFVHNKGRRTFEFEVMQESGKKKYEAQILKFNSERAIIIEDISSKHLRERIMSWAGFAQRLAHEVKNPLSTITLTLQRLQRIYRKKPGEETEKLDNYTNSILEEVERLRYTTDKFMRVLSLEKPMFEPKDIHLIIEEVMKKYEKVIPRKIKIKSLFGKNIPILHCDENQIVVLLSNIVENGIEAMGGGGTISIRTSLVENIIDNNIREFVEIRVEDTGEGISEGDKKNLFKPFFSRREGGTGLGLLIARYIVEKYNGKIVIESKQGIGTVVIILLPVGGENNEKG